MVGRMYSDFVACRRTKKKVESGSSLLGVQNAVAVAVVVVVVVGAVGVGIDLGAAQEKEVRCGCFGGCC